MSVATVYLNGIGGMQYIGYPALVNTSVLTVQRNGTTLTATLNPTPVGNEYYHHVANGQIWIDSNQPFNEMVVINGRQVFDKLTVVYRE